MGRGVFVGVFYVAGDGVVESALVAGWSEVVERLIEQRMNEPIL